MAGSIHIPLSDALEALIRSQAAARGTRTLDEAALAILTEALTSPARVPAAAADLEAELLKGLVGPGRAFTSAEWDARKAARSGTRL